MARKPNERPVAGPPPAAPIEETVIAQLVGARTSMAEVEDLFRQMKKQILERMLRGELTHHLGYGPDEPKPPTQSNHRNGTSPKTVLTEDGAVDLAFQPIHVHREERDYKVVKSRFVQPLGLFSGAVSVGEQRVELDKLAGVVEDQDVVW